MPPPASPGRKSQLLALCPHLPPSMQRAEWCMDDFIVMEKLYKGYASVGAHRPLARVWVPPGVLTVRSPMASAWSRCSKRPLPPLPPSPSRPRPHRPAVYKGVCKRSHEVVVLKSYTLSSVCELYQHQIFREVRLHSSLQHENIVKLYAAFKVGRACGVGLGGPEEH
jgi:serine/threonine protein kinase